MSTESSPWRRYWRIATVAVLGAVLAFAGSYMVESTYTTSTRLLIHGRDATFLTSTGETLANQPGVIDSTLSQSLSATYAGMATSRSVATAVVDDLELDSEEARSGPIAALAKGLAWVYRCGRAFVTAGFCAPVDPYEQAVAEIQEGTSVAPLGTNAGPTAGTTGSYVIQVEASGSTPEEAKAVTDAVANELVVTSASRFRSASAGSVASLEAQVADAEAEVAERATAVADFQDEHELLAADGGQALSATTYESVRSDLVEARAREADLIAQLDSITISLDGVPSEESSTQTIVTGRSTTEMNTSGSSSIYNELRTLRESVRSQLSGQSARVTELEQALTTTRPTAENAVLATLTTLENRLALAETNLADVTASLRLARGTVAQEPAELTRLDEATVPVYPSEPKRYMYLGLGLLLGALGGAALTAWAGRGTGPVPVGDTPDEPTRTVDLDPRDAIFGEDAPSTNGHGAPSPRAPEVVPR